MEDSTTTQPPGIPDTIDGMKAAMEEQIQRERSLVNLEVPAPPAPPAPPTAQQIEGAVRDNEDGDARLFAQLNQGRWVRDHSLDRWYRFSGHIWEQDRICQVVADVATVIDCYLREAERLAQAAKEEGRTYYQSLAEDMVGRARKLQTLPRKKKVLELASAGAGSLGIDGSRWDAEPYLLGCPNGVIDLRTGDMRPGRPDEYIKTACPTLWEGLDAPRPTWEFFLDDVFNHDTELISYLQRLLGYAITGTSTEDILPILQGKGRNGKSTLLETLHHVMGELSGPIDSEMLLDQYSSRSSAGPSPDIIDLRGRRIVWASETEDGRRLNSSKVKWLTGEEILKGRALHSDLVEFRKTHTLFLLTNALPHAPGNDYALWKRIHLIPFKFSYVDDPMTPDEKKADKALGGRLKEEASGILAWMVEGCLRWQEKGLAPPDAVTKETEKYQRDEDTIGRFLEEVCIKNPNGGVKAGVLYHAYRDWCSGEGIKYMNGTRFGKEMKRRLDYEDGRNVLYLGITLPEEDSQAGD